VPIARKTIDLKRPANITEVSRWKYRFIAIRTLSSFGLRNGMAFGYETVWLLVTKWYGFGGTKTEQISLCLNG